MFLVHGLEYSYFYYIHNAWASALLILHYGQCEGLNSGISKLDSRAFFMCFSLRDGFVSHNVKSSDIFRNRVRNKNNIFMNQEIEKITTKMRAGIPDGTANSSFDGPSDYFSQEALKACRKDFLGERHIEMVYATLASWGMHRTGVGGAKMPDYKVFHDSVTDNSSKLKMLQNKRIEKLSEEEFKESLYQIEVLCFADDGIKATTSNSRLVSSSKTLAHILPDLVPPIDREYTLNFFYGNTNLSDKRSKEALRKAMTMVHDIYHDIDQGKEMQCLAQAYQKTTSSIVSLPKIIDNVIIDIQGPVNEEKREEKKNNNK